jgi:hypothetical protein
MKKILGEAANEKPPETPEAKAAPVSPGQAGPAADTPSAATPAGRDFAVPADAVMPPESGAPETGHALPTGYPAISARLLASLETPEEAVARTAQNPPAPPAKYPHMNEEDRHRFDVVIDGLKSQLKEEEQKLSAAV